MSNFTPAQQFNILNYANTFGDWVVTTNALVLQNNDLAANNFTKASGTLYLSDPSLALQANTASIFQSSVQVIGVGSYAYIQNNLTVGAPGATSNGQVYLNYLGAGPALTSYGSILASGANTGLFVANTANIGGKLYVSNTASFSNTVTIYGTAYVANNLFSSNTVYADKIQGNTSVNTLVLTALTEVYTNLVQSNTAVSTNYLASDRVQANTSVTTTSVYASNSVTAMTVSAVSNVFTNSIQSNSSINTTNSIATVVQANSYVNTATLIAVSNVFTNTVQANGNVNTAYLTAVSNVISPTLIATSNVFANSIQANGSINTTLLTANTVQANLVVNTASVIATVNITTPTLTVTSNLYTTSLQANAFVNTVSVFVSSNVFANSIQANGSINTTTFTSNTVQANASVNTATLSVTGMATTGNVITNVVTANSAVIGAGGLTIAGNFIISGTTSFNSPQFTISANSPNPPVILNPGFAVYRSTANALIRWNEANTYWDMNDVSSGAFYRVLTDKYLSNSGTLNSGSNVATSAAVYSANNWLQANDALTLTTATAYANAANSWLQANISYALSTALTFSSNANNITSGILNLSRLPTSGVIAGAYGNTTTIPTVTVDQYGRVTSVSNNSISTSINLAGTSGTGSVSGGGTLTVNSSNASVANVTVSGSTFTVNPQLSGVVSGSYGNTTTIPTITVDQYGRVLSVSNNSVSTTINLAGTSGTGSVSGGNTLIVISANSSVTNVSVSGNTLTINPQLSGVVSGSYGNTTIIPTITVDQYGRVLSVSNNSVSTTINLAGTSGTGSVSGGSTLTVNSSNNSVTNVTATGSTLTVNPQTSGVSPGTYSISTITVDQYGRVTNASSGSVAGISITNETTAAYTYYPLLSLTTTGGLSTTNTSSTKLSFTPATGILAATGFSGSGAGLTGTGTNFTANTVSNITGTQVVNAIGYTPYNATNPNGYITSSGSANSATYALANSLIGTALATNVTGSSLTSVGTLTSLAVSGQTASTKGYREGVVYVGSVTGATNLDLSQGNIFNITLNGTGIVFTFTNPPAGNTACYINVFLTQGTGGSKTCSFTNARYTDAVAPVLTTTAGKTDIIAFTTIDGGSNYYGSFAGANFG